jgi:hypothetical protein
MTIALQAVGAAVYLIDAHAAAGAGDADMQGTAEAAPGISVPTGSGKGVAEAAAGAAGSMDDAASDTRAQAGVLRMLALNLDCGLDMQMKVRRVT